MKKLILVLMLIGVFCFDSMAYAGHGGGGYGGGRGRGWACATGGIVVGSLLTAAIIESNRPHYVPVVVGGVPYYAYNGAYYQYVNGSYMVVQPYVQQVAQPVMVQQPVVQQQVVQQPAEVQLTERTIKCPICGEPYKIYSNQAGDHSACPQCILKAVAKQKRAGSVWG